MDLVQVHFVSWAMQVGLPLARLIHRPCVVTAHGAITTTPPEFLRFVQEDADAVVLVSDNERHAWIERTGSSAKLHRVWNGLPLQDMPLRENKPSGSALRLVSIGRLEREKRIGDLIEAVVRLLDRGYACTLSVFGEGPQRSELQARIMERGVVDRVRLHGNVPHVDLTGHLAEADLLVHACDDEPFGLALVEGMAAGLPVVAAGSSGAREIVVHEQTGYLYAPGDVDALTAHLTSLADNPALGRAMGEAGRQRVAQEFSLDAHMQAMNQIWCRAVSMHRRS